VALVTAKNIERLAHFLAMVKEDESLRAELARSGALFGGYHPRMEAVHVANARALSTMIGEGWPTVAEVGEEGQRAAWLIVQHAISLPQFQRQCLALLQAAVARGEAPAPQVAMLPTASASSKDARSFTELNSTGMRMVRCRRSPSKMPAVWTSGVRKWGWNRSRKRRHAIGARRRRAVSSRQRIARSTSRVGRLGPGTSDGSKVDPDVRLPAGCFSSRMHYCLCRPMYGLPDAYPNMNCRNSPTLLRDHSTEGF
jgi:hypothetical protein